MTPSIRVATSPGEARIAVVEDNRLLDFALWRFGCPDGVGDVHRGRIIAHVPAMAGAFVALAGTEGFLPDSEGAKGLAAGAIRSVRVTRAAQGDKGPRLSARVGVLAAAGPMGLVRRGPDPLCRFAARYPDAPIWVDDPGLAAGLRLDNEVSVIPSVFDDTIAEAIDVLSHPVVELPGGARLSIWPTPALVAIDVDGASALGGRGDGRARHAALNRSILPAIAAQIRLRNLSGGILVDLAGLSARKRVALAPSFIAALGEDPLHPRFLGFTALGLAEVVRTRIHPPLHELLAGPLAAGLAGLRSVMQAFDNDPRALPAMRAHPAVVSALRADPVALADLARRCGRGIELRSDPSLPVATWMLENGHG